MEFFFITLLYKQTEAGAAMFGEIVHYFGQIVTILNNTTSLHALL